MWCKCDSCDGTTYTEDNPFVEGRTPRPSDKSDMCCTIAGHMKCFNKTTKPEASEHGGFATPEQWANWIKSKEAMKAGFLFLT